MEPPSDLQDRGREFWRQIVGVYDVRPDEEQTLAEACRVLDRLDAVRAIVAAEGLMATSPNGHRMMHPALVEERQQRIILARLLGTLGVPAGQAEAAADGDGIVSMKSARARRAARSRWSQEAR